jgi:hypothetical protein
MAIWRRIPQPIQSPYFFGAHARLSIAVATHTQAQKGPLQGETAAPPMTTLKRNSLAARLGGGRGGQGGGQQGTAARGEQERRVDLPERVL